MVQDRRREAPTRISGMRYLLGGEERSSGFPIVVRSSFSLPHRTRKNAMIWQANQSM